MPTEEWSISAKLLGEFYLGEDHSGELGAPMVEGLGMLDVRPDPEDGGEWTGRHTITATLAFEKPDDAELDALVLYERAKHLVDSVVALASIGVGRPISRSELSVTHRTGDDRH